ncbi:myosin-G heavy chain-like [Armigeres subalbatus]|uniref:myosin-G heavy chain-like n=1 Tax=Armigeres subalbatus TaxID=124917 RepID=UPI002ED3173D
MASKLTQALNISLDDYIAKKEIVSSLRTKSVAAPEANYFKRPMRSDVDDDDNDDLIYEDRNGMDIEQLETVEDDMPPLVRVTDSKEKIMEKTDELGEKRPTNVSIQVDNDHRCRKFVTEEMKRGIRHMPSQQWRLRRENQVSKKPTGVPPLVSVKAIFDRNTDRLIASLGENAKFQNDDARNRMNHRLQNNNGGRQWNNNRNRNKNYYNRNQGHQNRNQWNNNRNQYGKNPNMAPSFNPNVDRFEVRNGTQMDKNQITDLRSFITPPSTMQSQAAAGSLMPGGFYNTPNQMSQPQLVTFADMLNQIGRVADNQNREMFASAIRNAMCNQQPSSASMVPMMTPESVSRMNPVELMPFAAQTLLNHISTVQQNFGPKYDMKVQKEIHALQGKSLLYRANGVVSMDGSGIEDDKVKPVTTDLSMNMRFS